jgi:alcohol dehydrogenase (cytochrome c)
VFTGDPEGDFLALDARSGAKLWSFQTGAGHRGSAVSYAVNGRQYIATPTGWGSLVSNALMGVWPEAETFRTGSTLMVFALPEDGK